MEKITARFFWTFYAALVFGLSFTGSVWAAWDNTAVDAPKTFRNMSQRSIAVDSATNRPHIAYGCDSLFHAYYDGSQWQLETVDSSPYVGQYASIALDFNGKTHISYYEHRYPYGDLKYATNASGTWVTTTVDSGGDVGKCTSIAMDASGKAHISYYDVTNEDLMYATNASGSWVTATVDSGGNVGDYTSIAVDSSGKAYITYDDYTNHDLKYATNASGTWVATIVDSAYMSGFCNSIALDASGKAHISYAYYNGSYYSLKYATNASGTWVKTVVDGPENAGYYNSIALDASGKAYISYQYWSGTSGTLKYATNASGTWVATEVDAGGDLGEYASIALDTSDKAHISYYDLTNYNLKYATNASGTWVTATFDSAGDVGKYSSIATDSSGKAHISYRDEVNDDLKYATNASGTWVTATVDSAGDVGEYTSIAIDASGKAHISYYDYTNRDLKFATNASGTWVAATVDGNGYVGQYTSIAVDSSGKAHISYYDYTNRILKYATNASGTWVATMVDSGDVGQYSSMDLDSSGKAHISYHDHANYDLKYATNASGEWVATTVDSASTTGYWTSIALDASGKAHISLQGLRYATNASGTWVKNTVDGVSSGSYTSIAIDPSGKPHISYYSLQNADLKYAVYTDNVAPSSTITAPANGSEIGATSYAITGSASDNDIGVQEIEVGITPSGGPTTWYTADGTTSWSYTWSLSDVGTYTIQSRARDNANNIEAPGAGVTVTAKSVLSSDRSGIDISYNIARPAPITKLKFISQPTSVSGNTTTTRSWLTASPASGATPADITLTVNPAGLTVRNYTSSVTFTAAGAISPLRVPVSLTVVSGTSNPENQHYSWNAVLTGGDCGVCHLTRNKFLPSNFNRQDADYLCYSCHNSASVGHDSGDHDTKRHPIFIAATSGGCNWPTYGNITAAQKDNRPFANLKDGKTMVCATCHNAMGKNEDYGRVWESTTTEDRYAYYLLDGGWSSYGKLVPRVYRDTTLWGSGGPTYSRTKKDYLVSPSEYTYDEAAGTITFAAQQSSSVYIYVSLGYPYLRVSSQDNRLCADCHTETTHKGNNCLSCHQSHNTDNLAGIRGTVRTTDRSERAVKFLNLTGANSMADGGTTYDGICEVCHTTTKYYRRDGTGFVNHSGGFNYSRKRCTDCHSHATGFAK